MRAGSTISDETLAAIALVALGAGVLVYVTDRDGVQAWLLPRIDTLAGRHWFGAIGGWLPSAVHAFGFALLSAAVLPPTGPTRFVACASWAAIDVGFEFGQHPLVAPHLAAWLVGAPARYFERGTFDPADVAAAALGAALAAALLWRVRPHEENVDAP